MLVLGVPIARMIPSRAEIFIRSFSLLKVYPITLPRKTFHSFQGTVRLLVVHIHSFLYYVLYNEHATSDENENRQTPSFNQVGSHFTASPE